MPIRGPVHVQRMDFEHPTWAGKSVDIIYDREDRKVSGKDIETVINRLGASSGSKQFDIFTGADPTPDTDPEATAYQRALTTCPNCGGPARWVERPNEMPHWEHQARVTPPPPPPPDPNWRERAARPQPDRTYDGEPGVLDRIPVQPERPKPQATWHAGPDGISWYAKSPCGLVANVFPVGGVARIGTNPHGFTVRLETDHVNVGIASGHHSDWGPDDAKLAAEAAVELALRNLDLCQG